MNVNSGPEGETSCCRNEDQARQRARAEELQDDWALVHLDKKFVTLLSEISALERRADDLRRQYRENVRWDEAGRTCKIESVLDLLEPVERAIIATPARTIVGLGIKARHAAFVVSEHWDAPIEQINWDARAIRLLIEAVCKAAGVRLPFPSEEDL
jgi:hypothetical protein